MAAQRINTIDEDIFDPDSLDRFLANKLNEIVDDLNSNLHGGSRVKTSRGSRVKTSRGSRVKTSRGSRVKTSRGSRVLKGGGQIDVLFRELQNAMGEIPRDIVKVTTIVDKINEARDGTIPEIILAKSLTVAVICGMVNLIPTTAAAVATRVSGLGLTTDTVSNGLDTMMRSAADVLNQDPHVVAFTTAVNKWLTEQPCVKAGWLWMKCDRSPLSDFLTKMLSGAHFHQFLSSVGTSAVTGIATQSILLPFYAAKKGMGIAVDLFSKINDKILFFVKKQNYFQPHFTGVQLEEFTAAKKNVEQVDVMANLEAFFQEIGPKVGEIIENSDQDTLTGIGKTLGGIHIDPQAARHKAWTAAKQRADAAAAQNRRATSKDERRASMAPYGGGGTLISKRRMNKKRKHRTKKNINKHRYRRSTYQKN